MQYYKGNLGILEDQHKKRSNKIRKRKRVKRLIKIKRNPKKMSKRYNDTSFISFLKSTKFVEDIKVSAKINRRNIAIVKIPKNFSLIEQPDEAIEVFQLIYELHKKKIRGIHFDHSSCSNMDIGASAVMDVLTLNLDKYFKKKNVNLNFEGTHADDPKVSRLIVTSGIVKILGAAEDLRKQYLESGLIKNTELISGGRHTPTFKVESLPSVDGKSVSDYAATKVAEYFSECVHTQGYLLEAEGEQFISQIVSETINNCELHSGMFCQWFAQGFYLIENKDKYGEVHLVLFNFGQTIYQGLKYQTKSQSMYEQMEKLSQEHLKKGFFTEQWDEEVLWTLYALQDGVSRMRSDSALDRGNGTIDLITAFQAIGGTLDGKKPTMSIISGNAYIYFDKSYTLEPVETEGNQRYQIAFNESNDLRQPPDKKYVKKLKRFFPGTAITLRFYLEKEYIEELRNNGKND
jgi:hypothetical protein